MSIDRIRVMPLDKILSSRRNVDNQVDHNSINDDSDLSLDSERVILPPPRRHNRTRREPSHRHLLIKCIVGLTIILLILVFLLRYRQRETNMKRRLTILLWNEDAIQGFKSFRQCQCIVTNYRNFTRSPVDAIVINADQPYSLEGLEEIRRVPDFYLVFASRKPLNEAEDPLIQQDVANFNLTMTYRLDSDLIWTEYYFSPLRRPNLRIQKFAVPEKHYVEQMTSMAANELRFTMKLKQELAVYMLFDVNNFTARQSRYLEKMRKHIQLNGLETCHEPNDCLPYKFMLIFEPSGCPDYVHPQLYMALANSVVPVLIGGGNLTHVVPPGSYISAADYASPEELAKHLLTLSSQPELYSQFFWWHSKYQIHRIYNAYCGLCYRLQQARTPRDPLDFSQWWQQSECPESENFLAKMAN